MTENNQSFPARSRLKKPLEFKRVFANPAKSSDQYFTLLAIPNEARHARLGLAIAKKIVPRAVDRNFLKRVIRESFRTHQGQLEDIDIVVLARHEALKAQRTELSSSLSKHWTRISNRCKTFS